MKPTPRLYSLLAVLLLLMSWSCKKDTELAKHIIYVAPTQEEVSWHQTASFRVQFTADDLASTYPGLIGGQAVRVSRIDDTFSFEMPAVTAGPQTLEVTLEGWPYQVSFVVRQPG